MSRVRWRLIRAYTHDYRRIPLVPGVSASGIFLTNLKLVLIFLLIETVDMIPLLRRFTVN